MGEILSKSEWNEIGRRVPKGTAPVETETWHVCTMSRTGTRHKTVTVELFDESQVTVTAYGRLVDLCEDHGLVVDKSEAVPGMLEVSPSAETHSDPAMVHAMLIEGKFYCGVKFYGGVKEALADLPAMLPPTIQLVHDSRLERESWFNQQ